MTHPTRRKPQARNISDLADRVAITRLPLDAEIQLSELLSLQDSIEDVRKA